MSKDHEIFSYHLNLIKAFRDFATQQTPFVEDILAESEREFLDLLNELTDASANTESFNHQGQNMISKLVASYSHLTPHMHRDLFWYFGGDCLHYMPDEEIANYQLLDERRYEAESQNLAFHYEDERAKVFGLH